MQKTLLLSATLSSALFSQTGVAQNFRLIATHPNDSTIFTQGLERTAEGRLLYSSGLYGVSEISYLDLQSGKREVKAKLPPEYFAEGLTQTPFGIWQLSWLEQSAFLRDPHTFKIKRQAHYSGEGWGIAYDPTREILWLSNGSATLQQFHPETFQKLGELQITEQNQPLVMINELEFANGYLYANIWQQPYIVKIDLQSGEVVQKYDFSTLIAPLKLEDPDAVLNGIAHLSGDRFLVTGKNYPVLWEVTFDDKK